MIALQIGRNASTSLYEVHKSGCRHLRRLEGVSSSFAAESAVGAAIAHAEGNDGIVVTLGPCVEGPAEAIFASAWTQAELGIPAEEVRECVSCLFQYLPSRGPCMICGSTVTQKFVLQTVEVALCEHGDHFDSANPDPDECRSCREAEDGPGDDDWIHAAYMRQAEAGIEMDTHIGMSGR